jgi:sirohydrochlorin ferrochelatase
MDGNGQDGMRYPHLRLADGRAHRGGPAGGGARPPLVAVAHGSADPRAGAAIGDLITVARARAAARGVPELDARAAFLARAAPSAAQVLAGLAGGVPARPGEGIRGPGHRGPVPARHVVVLPLLLTAAYHSDTDIPGVLREAQDAFPWLTIAYGEPLGPHPALLRALDRRLAEAGENLRPAARKAPRGLAGRRASTAVVLAAAGSSRPAANAAVARMAADWQAARGWRAVVPAYASAASPTPGQAVAALLRDGAQRVVVATYLLAPGLFADRIRDASLAAGAAAVSGPLGAAPEVADVLLQRYAEARSAATRQPAGRPGLALERRASARA